MKYEKVKEIFKNLSGNTFIGIDTETTVTLKGGKKNPLQGKVRKVVTGANTMVYTNEKSNAYENMVKRRLEKEGANSDEFKLQPRKWGKRIEGTPFVEHNGQYYLELIFMSPGKSEYFIDDEKVNNPEEEIEGFPVKKDYGGQGGLEDKVVIRTFKVESLKAIKTGGKTYE